jgi:hypothetical protein
VSVSPITTPAGIVLVEVTALVPLPVKKLFAKVAVPMK